MSRNHRIAALALILAFALAGAAQALPSISRSGLAPKADGILAIVREWVSGLPSMWEEAGSSMDPNGGGTTDAGSDMDPDGRPATDEGSDMDPNG